MWVMRRIELRTMLALTIGLCAWTNSAAQSLTWLGTLGGNESAAYDVSADGSVVVGASADAQGQIRAFRWTAQTGMIDLGTLSPYSGSLARGVSADGLTVVGYVADNPYAYSEHYRAFLWTSTSGMQYLPPLASRFSMAFAVSADGSAVVGTATNIQGQVLAFRWTPQTEVEWLSAPDSIWMYAFDIAANKRYVVGTGETPAGIFAFRWENGIAQALSTPVNTPSAAYAVSADGSVVVGQIGYSGQFRAFRWQNGVMQDIGGQWNRSIAYGVSADGSIVVGVAGSRAFRWTAQTGLQDLNVVYSDLLDYGSELWEATATSPNGRYIVGYGWNMARWRFEAFLLDTGVPLHGDVNRDGCVDDADLLSILFTFGNFGYRNEDLNWDGEVDDADLLIALFNFGQGC